MSVMSGARRRRLPIVAFAIAVSVAACLGSSVTENTGAAGAADAGDGGTSIRAIEQSPDFALSASDPTHATVRMHGTDLQPLYDALSVVSVDMTISGNIGGDAGVPPSDVGIGFDRHVTVSAGGDASTSIPNNPVYVDSTLPHAPNFGSLRGIVDLVSSLALDPSTFGEVSIPLLADGAVHPAGTTVGSASEQNMSIHISACPPTDLAAFVASGAARTTDCGPIGWVQVPNVGPVIRIPWHVTISGLSVTAQCDCSSPTIGLCARSCPQIPAPCDQAIVTYNLNGPATAMEFALYTDLVPTQCSRTPPGDASSTTPLCVQFSPDDLTVPPTPIRAPNAGLRMLITAASMRLIFLDGSSVPAVGDLPLGSGSIDPNGNYLCGLLVGTLSGAFSISGHIDPILLTTMSEVLGPRIQGALFQDFFQPSVPPSNVEMPVMRV